MNQFHPYAIIEIRVEGLFGYIDQTLTTNDDSCDKISQLAILYGENGTGKTTLLRLAFHLLSPRVDRGHKTRLSATPFKSLRISLRDGTKFAAEREKAENGDFVFSVKRPRKKILFHEFSVEPDGTGIAPYFFEPNLQEAILDCASTVVFLRDDRKIEIEPNATSPNPWRELTTATPDTAGRRKLFRHFEEDFVRREEPVQLADAVRASIERLDRWFSVEYGQRTSTGMASSHAIYGEVIERVVSARGVRRSTLSLESVIENLVELSKTSAVFEKYGLSSPMGVKPIIQTLKRASPEQQDLLEELLAPYIETVRARFSELGEVYENLDTFIRQTNQFMRPKTITYRVGEGLKIHSPRGQPLNPTELSSGERHLLLILSNAVLARTDRTLFIIDEPEISLNSVRPKTPNGLKINWKYLD